MQVEVPEVPRALASGVTRFLRSMLYGGAATLLAFALGFPLAYFIAFRGGRYKSLLLFLIMGFGFSGYLLPWNQLAFFATKVGTDVGGAIPLVGEWTVRFLRGGDRVSGATAGPRPSSQSTCFATSAWSRAAVA